MTQHHEHEPRRSGAVLYLLDDVAATSRAMAALARAAQRARVIEDLNASWPAFDADIRRKAAHALRRQQRAAKARLIRRRPQAAAGGRATPFHGGRP